MFSFGKFSKPETDTVAIFDIGSSSVCAGLVEFARGNKEGGQNFPAHVLFASREVIEFRAELDPQSFFKDMLIALERAHMAITKQGVKVTRVFYVFSSPWSASQTRVVTIEKPEPFVLTKAMVDRVIEEEARIFEASALGGLKEGISDKLSTIEKRIVSISLNGYDIAEPYGKKTRSAEVSFFTTIVPKVVLDKVLDISIQTYHPKDTHSYSFPLVAFSIVRDLFHDVHDFIFLNIGGEVCDVSIIKKGLITESASFPLGSHFLVRNISKSFNISAVQAESMLKLYLDNHSDEYTKEKLAPMIADLAKQWVTTLHSLVFKLSDTVSLPQDLFMTSDSSLIKFFTQAIKSEDVMRPGVEGTPFTVTTLGVDTFKKLAIFSPEARADASIALITAFLNSRM